MKNEMKISLYDKILSMIPTSDKEKVEEMMLLRAAEVDAISKDELYDIIMAYSFLFHRIVKRETKDIMVSIE